METGVPPTEEEFQAIGGQLDELVQEFERLPYPGVQERVFDLLRAVDALHRAGLSRLVARLRARDDGEALAWVAADPVVRTLFLLYDLVPDDPVVETAPEPEPAPGTIFIPFESIGRAPPRGPRRPVFAEVARVDEVPPGTMREVVVDDLRALVANVAGELFGVRNRCPGSVAPLHLGSFTPPVVVCPWHNEAFDVRTGKRVDGGSGPGLEVLPLSVQDGAVLLAVDTQAQPAGLPVRPR